MKTSDSHFENLPLEERSEWVKQVIKRCCEAWGVEKAYEIKEIHVGRSALTNWVTRGSMPYQFVFTTALKKGADLNYLLLGQKIISSADKEAVMSKVANVLHQGKLFGYFDQSTEDRLLQRIDNEISGKSNYNKKAS